MRYGLLAIGCLSLFLSSCADNQPESASSSSRYQWSSTIGSLPSSSSLAESSGNKSTAIVMSPESSEKSKSSSSSTVYYTVSIYQSYYIEEEKAYGNPRFDIEVTREANEYLYNSMEEIQSLELLCRPIYPRNSLHIIDGFYSDRECTKIIPYGVKVNSNLEIFYYCW